MAITAHVCDALHYAHERGIVHRDIKPANIMVGYDGRVKVADFGLAKSFLQVDANLTRSGYVMGTPHFVAPEALILGMQVDQRADIYAVGVMLYQMLTGKVPQGMFEMPSMQVPGLDPRYDHIIARAMREDREQRYPTIQEMRRALDGILTQPVQRSQRVPQAADGGVTVKPVPGSPSPRAAQSASTAPLVMKKASGLWWLVAVLLALILGGIAWIKPSGSAVRSVVNAVTVEQASKDTPFINSLGMSFVPVPGTRVLMCQHETRRQDYEAYAVGMPGADESWRNQQFNNKPCGHQDAHPVLGVSWNDAKAFCEWLGKKEGLKVRLPTDREWSQAAGIAKDESWDAQSSPKTRDGVLKTYTWGPSHPPRSSEVEGNYGDSTYGAQHPGESFIECYDGFPSTAPVKSFNANGFGLHDLGGNAREWVEDLWDAGSSDHVLRGSAWHSTFWNGMVTSRRQAAPADTRSYETGFRCVIEMPESFPDQPLPKVVSPFSPIDDPAFEKQIGSYSWKMRNRDWVAYFGPNHEALVREGDEYRMWHWWVVAPRTIHVQFAVQSAQFDPSIGEDRIVDPDMTTMTRLSNKEVVTDRDRSIDPAWMGSDDGFVTLLGPEGTDGWTYSGPPGAGFTQADGGIAFAGRKLGSQNGLFWYSKRTFADFVLRLDFKITDYKKNSGVHVRLPALKPGGQPALHPQGLEIEILHEETGGIPFTTQKSLRPPRLIVGDWNTYEIIVRGAEVTARLNGVEVTRFQNAPPAPGYIALQDYDDGLPISFRNVRIRDLSSPHAP
jgi:formylglycine-generating enzyme required for sulfatase activity